MGIHNAIREPLPSSEPMWRVISSTKTTDPKAPLPIGHRPVRLKTAIRHVLAYMGNFGALGILALSLGALMYAPVFLLLRVLKPVTEVLSFGAYTIAPRTSPSDTSVR